MPLILKTPLMAMIINTAAIDARLQVRRLPASRFHSLSSLKQGTANAVTGLLLAFACIESHASPTPGGWTPLFKGVDHAVGTNDPSIPGSFPERQVVHCVRVDLTDSDVHLLATPRASNYAEDSRETLTQSVPNFLRQNLLQIAADADFYSANPGGSDPNSEGISCEVFGLQISRGEVVSPVTSSDAAGDPRFASILFSTNNQASFVFNNRPPGTNTAGIYTAITGYYPIVSNGVNIGAASINSYPDSFIHQVQPRTAYGLTKDGKYLLLLTIDGRQQGYSDGALDTETAYWILQFGAWNAINMDGGGSTALYMADSAGNPVAVNHSSYLPAYGHERFIGSHFGVSAKPLPGFVNDVNALPDDTAATVTWGTTNPATSLVQYGPTTGLGYATPYSSVMVTNHSALLTGLSPGTGYYYRVFSSDGPNQYSSGFLFFTTTNYANSNLVFDFTNSWSYGTANLDGVNWTAPNYDDSGWAGSGPGLLWIDTRGSARPPLPLPTITEMPANGSSPYPTYYFRTHFTFTNSLNGVTLVATAYLDDGAVFYLNGTEVYRLRMPDYPAAILNTTLATGYACSNSVDYGDAVCPDVWSVSGNLMTNLVVGDNVLAAEVHNYNAGSPDITFGLSLSDTTPSSAPPQLNIEQSNSLLTLSWARGGFTLQQANSPAGPWANVPGPIVSSPFSTNNSGTTLFFRLLK